MIVSSLTTLERTLQSCAADIEALYARCVEAAPNYGVGLEDFTTAIATAVKKYLVPDASDPIELSVDDIRQFLGELQISDLYLALACARGNEQAWWDFDAGYRRFIERVAQHLASATSEAEEVIDSVYTELYGTRVIDGVRQSKFATYTGRGTLRGWLRAIVWHAIVDLHRARHDEISIDEWSESGGEAEDRPGWRAQSHGGENAMIDYIARERYGTATVAALNASFAALEDHEKLLLLYYHVENLKLREIARFVEEPRSPLRRWFQRQSKQRVALPESRVHESTVMRWLEKVYSKVRKRFCEELKGKSELNTEEIDICLSMASGDLAPEDVRRHLRKPATENLGKDKIE